MKMYLTGLSLAVLLVSGQPMIKHLQRAVASQESVSLSPQVNVCWPSNHCLSP